ncbi:SsrA-binding protein SmpB [Verrucomicrobiota bacterium]
MTSLSENPNKKLAVNRKALRDYQVVERIEAGIQLQGTEVKSIKSSQISLAGGFARVAKGEVFLHNINVPLYEHGNKFNHDPDRTRRLLLHKAQINKLEIQIEQRGFALVPLSVYMKRGMIKIELGLCRGKRQRDKRETLRRKTADREAEREIARRSRG